MPRIARYAALLVLALAASGDRAWAQRSARAAVSVAVVPPVLTAKTLDRAVAVAMARPAPTAPHALPAGALLMASAPQRPGRNALAIRRFTLVYAAN